MDTIAYEKRKILFTNGMSSDFMIMITDAPKEDIEAWCYRYNEALENGTYGDGKEVQLFDTLKAKYYVKELLDSEVDDCDREVLDVIGYDEAYDLADYYYEEADYFEENLNADSNTTNIGRVLSEEEKEIYLNNRQTLHEHLSELQADFEDLSNEDLIDCRDVILKRVNLCLKAILETDEDNIM